MFEIAHLTDLHIGPLPNVSYRQLLSKRFFGFLSWHRKRHLLHRIDVIEALLADLATHHADHTVITGDMVNIALAQEFKNAATWLERFGPPDEVSLVPGNHDAYVKGRYREHWDLWRDYMTMDGGDHISFPYVRRRGPVAFVGLSSAIPSPVAFAYGRMGRQQVQALEPILRQLRSEECFIVILIHHPPLARLHYRRNLRDHGEFAEVIAKTGADLILSGHQHRHELGSLPGPDGPVPVIVTPSSSLDDPYRREEGGYMRLRIDPGDGRIAIQLRRYDRQRNAFQSDMEGHLMRKNDEVMLVAGDWSTTAV